MLDRVCVSLGLCRSEVVVARVYATLVITATMMSVIMATVLISSRRRQRLSQWYQQMKTYPSRSAASVVSVDSQGVKLCQTASPPPLARDASNPLVQT